ncbi:MAG: ATP cone domain-containing protein [Candidatus Aenigmatarchaeota archaeon]
MIYVTKANGTKESFDKNKIINTCLKLKLNYQQAQEVVKKIEKKVYDGISTKKILKMIFRYAKLYRPSIGYQVDLKESISLLRPKPDFEKFIGIVFSVLGYKTETNLILKGACVEHEIDVVAKKNEETIIVEVKHHVNPHKYTGLDVFLEVNSTLEDLKEGFKIGNHPYNFSKALVICNTKISEHAKKYSLCKKIEAIAWKYPENFGLEKIIEENKIYPITFLKEISSFELQKLGDCGIVTIKQLLDDARKISSKTKISLKRIEELQEKSRIILKS